MADLALPENAGRLPPRKMALVMAISVWPTITALLWLLWPVLQDLPLPGRTLVLTLVMVPLMTWIVVPFVTRAVARWLG